jgi:mono/diheme cytochrome c family protein
MFQRPFIVLIALLPLSAAEKVTYDEQVLPIFQQACLNCHNPDKTKGGLDLSSYTGTMKGGSGGKIVEPGDVASTLIAVVKHSAEPAMPPEGDKLANEQITILVKWIEGGLLENPSSSARKPTKPKFAAAQTDPAAKPEGPPPMPEHLLLDPPVVTEKAAAVQAIAASPWAPLVAITGQRQVLLHHSESLEPVGILPFPEGDPVSLAFTPEGRYLIVGGGVPGKSGITVTFDVTNGSRLLTAGREFDSVLAADIRPGFDIVATGGPSRLLKMWDTGTGEMVKSIKKHTDWITALDISPDGVLLATGDRNGGVWAWESETGAEFHTLRAHQATITAVVFRSDSNLLATASEDGTVRYWEMNGGTEVRKNDAHPGGVTALGLARDGTALTTGRDHKAKLWKPDFGLLREIAPKFPSLPTAAALDADGTRAFIGDAAGAVRVYQTADGKVLGEILTNPPRIETRLQTITSAITEAEQALAAKQGELGARKAKVEDARKAISQAENSHRQAIQIRKAADAGVAQASDDATRKIAEDAAKRVTAAEQGLQAKRKELTATEATIGPAEGEVKEHDKQLENLRASLKRWSAAAINTRRLVAENEATANHAALEQIQDEFTTAAREVTARAEALNRKRAERDQLAAVPTPENETPEALTERRATLEAVDAAVAKELVALRQAEAALDKIRSRSDSSASAVWTKKSEGERLREDYLKALE